MSKIYQGTVASDAKGDVFAITTVGRELGGVFCPERTRKKISNVRVARNFIRAECRG